jgi:transposase-like protein
LKKIRTNGTGVEVGLVPSKKRQPSEEGPGHVGGPERSSDSRSESGRSGGIPTSRRESPEVRITPVRRHFTSEFKKRVLDELAQCRNRGDVSALLRREGLYSSVVTAWRRDFEQGGIQALKPKSVGRKPTRNPLVDENEKLRRENAKLQERLAKAQLIIDVQKKVARILGDPLPDEPKTDEETSS